MILVDTSVWIDHFRSNDDELKNQLASNNVLIHPFILGELACGNLKNRNEILKFLTGLAKSSVASDTEVLFFIEQQQLMGKGLGYIDNHLLAATALNNPSWFWTRDKRLKSIAESLSLHWKNNETFNKLE